ncbi:hypothetical protein BTR25_06640 [Bacillus sp. MRMR6]|nr:hypothetical protein BTR25_06640 [Bacillus sp. MRMR6]
MPVAPGQGASAFLCPAPAPRGSGHKPPTEEGKKRLLAACVLCRSPLVKALPLFFVQLQRLGARVISHPRKKAKSALFRVHLMPVAPGQGASAFLSAS